MELIWDPRHFEIDGHTYFTTTILRPRIKTMIQKALVERKISWEYLFEVGYFEFASAHCLPEYHLTVVTEKMIRSDPKITDVYSQLQSHALWAWIELDWYNPVARRLLRQENICLRDADPWFTRGQHCPPLMEFSHSSKWMNSVPDPNRPGHWKRPTCDCFYCLSIPYSHLVEERNHKLIEMECKKEGIPCISWAEKVEQDSGAYCLDASDLFEYGRSEFGTFHIFIPDRTARTNGPPGYQCSVEKRKRITAILKLAMKEKRFPTHKELDEISVLRFGIPGRIDAAPLPRSEVIGVKATVSHPPGRSPVVVPPPLGSPPGSRSDHRSSSTSFAALAPAPDPAPPSTSAKRRARRRGPTSASTAASSSTDAAVSAPPSLSDWPSSTGTLGKRGLGQESPLLYGQSDSVPAPGYSTALGGLASSMSEVEEDASPTLWGSGRARRASSKPLGFSGYIEDDDEGAATLGGPSLSHSRVRAREVEAGEKMKVADSFGTDSSLSFELSSDSGEEDSDSDSLDLDTSSGDEGGGQGVMRVSSGVKAKPVQAGG